MQWTPPFKHTNGFQFQPQARTALATISKQNDRFMPLRSCMSRGAVTGAGGQRLGEYLRHSSSAWQNREIRYWRTFWNAFFRQNLPDSLRFACSTRIN
jgi:hypothetical protein